MLTTDGTLLGGRIRYRQPEQGFRSGIEPVLLAATVAARPGQRVLEVGTGAGAALLCLSHRISGVAVTGVEIDPALAVLAAENAAVNGFDNATVLARDIATLRLDGGFDHAMANPPYHAAAATASPDGSRAVAKRGSEALFAAWIARMAAALRHRGTLTLIVAAWAVPGCVKAMAGGDCRCVALVPLWPRAGVAAKLVILRGIKGGRAPFAVRPGLVLHRADGGFTEAADAVLREGAALAI